jgi:Peptidase family M28
MRPGIWGGAMQSVRRFAVVAAVALVAAGCTRAQIDVSVLASDTFAGRNNATAGSVASQDYLIAQLHYLGATGLDPARTGDDSYKQPFTSGTNILGVIPGTALPNEYVMVGAHYDHLGSTCRNAGPADSICNGATDNAAGVAATLEIGRTIAALPGGPHRSVILAFWDREEDGLLGSQYYTQHPIVPLASTVAYVNFDIQGANLLPSLRDASFAVGAETGGARLEDAVQTAVGATLHTRRVSSIFGQGRSDYVNFTAVGVPNVFFSDSTGPCYHTVDDETAIVDWNKLKIQTGIATRLTEDLVAGTPPPFVGDAPLATYEDAVQLGEVVHQAQADLGRFSQPQQDQMTAFRDQLDAVIADGPAQFDDTDVPPLLSGAAMAVSILTSGACDGFLAP